MNDNQLFTKISNHPSKNERVAWKRKHKKMQSIIEEKVAPLEEKILELIMEKQVHLDEVIEIRDTLSKECIHSKEFLVNKGDHVLCKFCNRKLRVNVQ
jgi:hypothetical protein